MNRFLSDMLGFLNALAAIVIIIGGGFTGADYGRVIAAGEGSDVGRYQGIGLIIGLGLGAVGASLVCGLIAVMVETLRTQREILSALKAQTPIGPPKL